MQSMHTPQEGPSILTGYCARPVREVNIFSLFTPAGGEGVPPSGQQGEEYLTFQLIEGGGVTYLPADMGVYLPSSQQGGTYLK